MQYIRPKKRLRERQGGNGGLSRLRAYGVFTDQGIHISCAGCPSGWPDMLTVYPEFEVGIPIICSNCPTNWPGALNLLGVGGDPSWGQSNDPPINGDRSAGNNFMTFDTGSNFGGGRDNAFPASDYGGDGSDNYYGNLDGVDPGGLGQNEGLPTSDMT
ncbi:Hypothetical predicted protein [Cloeon dipterum]|uniref:Uncharacterized protein n=2 Tax=Cloeon dipterum TaxID=197152 RepID=A0A8S1CZD0_9INSE|nr:Hypothetical predicted protein [Cloeon dipterum]